MHESLLEYFDAAASFAALLLAYAVLRQMRHLRAKIERREWTADTDAGGAYAYVEQYRQDREADVPPWQRHDDMLAQAAEIQDDELAVLPDEFKAENLPHDRLAAALDEMDRQTVQFLKDRAKSVTIYADGPGYHTTRDHRGNVLETTVPDGKRHNVVPSNGWKICASCGKVEPDKLWCPGSKPCCEPYARGSLFHDSDCPIGRNIIDAARADARAQIDEANRNADRTARQIMGFTNAYDRDPALRDKIGRLYAIGDDVDRMDGGIHAIPHERRTEAERQAGMPTAPPSLIAQCNRCGMPAITGHQCLRPRPIVRGNIVDVGPCDLCQTMVHGEVIGITPDHYVVQCILNTGSCEACGRFEYAGIVHVAKGSPQDESRSDEAPSQTGHELPDDHAPSEETPGVQ